MAWELCSSGAAIAKAGVNANATVIADGTKLGEWNSEVQGFLCAKTRKDWVANITSVKANFKPILADVCSDLMAIKIIAYDMSGYTSRAEAQTMCNIYFDNANTIIKDLREQKIQEVM